MRMTMRKELSWKVLLPLGLVVLFVLAYFASTLVLEPTVTSADIKPPPPPGGFPASAQSTQPAPPTMVGPGE